MADTDTDPSIAVTGRVFSTTMLVRFRHCDPAGIVFYPRYFEMINDLVEEWFDQGLGLSFEALHAGRGIGTPLASVQCNFFAPSRWNETLTQTLIVRRIGGASFTAEVQFFGADGDSRLNAALTIVTVDLNRMKSIAMPDDLRQRMQEFLLLQDGDNHENSTTP